MDIKLPKKMLGMKLPGGAKVEAVGIEQTALEDGASYAAVFTRGNGETGA